MVYKSVVVYVEVKASLLLVGYEYDEAALLSYDVLS